MKNERNIAAIYKASRLAAGYRRRSGIMYNIQDAVPVTLELKRAGMEIMDPFAVAISVIIGLLCLGSIYVALRKLG